jgi:RimJ/RimL family protein N-acetyltransferase
MRKLLPPDPPLQDEDLLLRQGTEADVQAISDVCSEPDIRTLMEWDDELPDESEARRNIERADRSWEEGSWAVFRIVDKAAGKVVGGVNLRLGEHDVAEVSYFLSRAARGRGFATRAVRLVSRRAFEQLGIELRSHPDNEASVRVAERAGFTREGVEGASRAWPDGRRFDSVLDSLLPTD